MLLGIVAVVLYVLIIPMMAALGMALSLYLWAPRLSSSNRGLLASIAGPSLVMGPAFFAPAAASGTPVWAVSFGVVVLLAVLGALCFPVVRIATRRLEQLHASDASVFQ